ncbi:MAG TPA: homoserine O-succinyltransferase [Acidobacteriaceae bacterium]
MSKTLTIGLVNNMPDAALEATERQFVALLEAASPDFTIALRLYSLPGVPRGRAAASRIASFYADTHALRTAKIDALIVTGREPISASLQDEPYWEEFTAILDWARDNTLSTVWSCLAAHAAVLYTDGIQRVRNNRKHSGVFEGSRVSLHPLIEGTPSPFRLPHSRWNGLPEDHLTRAGYQVLTNSAAGVDTFVRHDKSLFVYFQGHPEYESNTLLLEFRRDIARHLRGETAAYPCIPCGYFDEKTEAALREFGREAKLFPREELIGTMSSLLEAVRVENSWQTTAVCIYRNWLAYVSTQKRLRLSQSIAYDAELQHSHARNDNDIDAIMPASDGQFPSTASTASRATLTIL